VNWKRSLVSAAKAVIARLLNKQGGTIVSQDGKSYLCDDIVLGDQWRSIKYRVRAVGWLAACFFPAVFLSLGLSQKGNIEFAAWVFFVFLVGQFTFRLFRERSIIRNRAGSVATVIGAARKPLEAGHVRSLRYRFAAADGKIYSGKSGWTGKTLPQVGQTVPVLYKQNDPSHNLALFDFWFYTFNF